MTLIEEVQLNYLDEIEKDLNFWFNIKGNSKVKQNNILTLLDMKLLINEAYY